MTSIPSIHGAAPAPGAGRPAGAGVADSADTARHQAASLLETGKAEALRAVDAGRATGAETVHGVADAARKAADDLERSSPELARLTRDAAAMADQLSDSIRSTSLGTLVHRVEGFARREPVAFFGAALATGFALTRFLGASARHGTDAASPPQGRMPTTGMPAVDHLAADGAPRRPVAAGPEVARHLAGAAQVQAQSQNTSKAAATAADTPEDHRTVGSASHPGAPAKPASTGLASRTEGTPSSPASAFSSAGTTAGASAAPSGPATPVRPDPAADRPQDTTRSVEAGKAIGGPSGPEAAIR